MRRRFALFAAVVALAGCGSYRRVAPLDDAERAEMETLRAELRGRRVIIPSGRSDAAEALGVLGVETVPRGAPDVAGLAEIEGGQKVGVCMNPMMGTFLTLGVLPYVSPQGSTWNWRFIDAEGREHGTRLEVADTATIGWLALPFGLLPGRSAFFFSSTQDEAQRTAIRDRLALFVGRHLAGHAQ